MRGRLSPPFCVGFVNGWRRATALLSIIAGIKELEIPVEEILRDFHVAWLVNKGLWIIELFGCKLPFVPCEFFLENWSQVFVRHQHGRSMQLWAHIAMPGNKCLQTGQ